MNEKTFAQQPEVVQPVVDANIENCHQANGTTYFVIKVTQQNGACWCVDKRFGEFEALRSSLEFEGIYHPELNKNYNAKNLADAVRVRSIDLGMFLHCLLRDADNLLVRQFLQIDQPVFANPFMEPSAKQQESHVETKVSEPYYTSRARSTAAPLEPFNLRDAERGLDAMATLHCSPTSLDCQTQQIDQCQQQNASGTPEPAPVSQPPLPQFTRSHVRSHANKRSMNHLEKHQMRLARRSWMGRELQLLCVLQKMCLPTCRPPRGAQYRQ